MATSSFRPPPSLPTYTIPATLTSGRLTLLDTISSPPSQSFTSVKETAYMEQPAARRHRTKRPGIQAPQPKSHHQAPSGHLFTRYHNVPSLPPPSLLSYPRPHPASSFPGTSSSSSHLRSDQHCYAQTTMAASLAPAGTPGIPSVSSNRDRNHRRQRSHPFLNLTFTALHEPASPQSRPSPQPSLSQHASPRGTNATGSSSTSEFGSSALVTGPTSHAAPSQGGEHQQRRRTTSSGSGVDHALPALTSTKRRPARSLPSSPGPTRRPSLSQPSIPLHGLDPRKEYFFTPSSTPVVLPPMSPGDPAAPRMRKRSMGSAKSAPTSPIASLTPVSSRVNLREYAEQMRLERSGSMSEAIHALRNQQQQQWVANGTTPTGEFPVGGNFFASRPQYAPRYATSPEEEVVVDDADGVQFEGRKKRSTSRGLTRSRSGTAINAVLESVAVDATPTLSRRPSEVTLRALPIQTSPPPPEAEMDEVPLPATTSTDHEVDHRTVSILYALRYLAAIPVMQTAVSNLHLAIFAKSSTDRTYHGLTSVWAIAAALALVNLTTSLLRRWLHNCRFPPFPHILIRLLALQLGILFPSLHLTLSILNPRAAEGISRRTVVAWCFLATAISVLGEAVRPWTAVKTRATSASLENDKLSEKRGAQRHGGEEPSGEESPVHFHLAQVRQTASAPLFPIIFAYVATSWAMLLA